MNGIHLYHRFEDIPAPLLERLEAAGNASDFSLTPDWLRHLADTARDANQQLRIYCLQRADGAALLPMYETARGAWPFSRRLSSQANYYSALAGPLGAQGEAGATAVREIVAAIAAERPRWSSVDLRPLPLDGAVFGTLEQALRDAGMKVLPYFCFGNWYLQVGGRSYDQYYASLPSRLRNTLARKSRQLQAEGETQLDIIEGGAALERGIEDYLRIYRASWKKPEPFPDFIPGLIRLCARQGSLRLGVLRIGGEPAAAQIWIVHNGVAAIYKLAYDARFAALSAGSALTAAMMRHVIDIDRVSEVDYLMGDDAYKQDWMSHRRERWGLMAFNLRTVGGVFGALRHCAPRVLRQLPKSMSTLLQHGKKNPAPARLSGAPAVVTGDANCSVIVAFDASKK
ncbi:GNAT family N-acetyltransferase [Herbaspirillum robiniae]|uniref:GNAT family N-acetyltransferase n=1 Tax=Herbaspirillum robiniae TaxID=2014887 RepID=UPI003D779E22